MSLKNRDSKIQKSGHQFTPSQSLYSINYARQVDYGNRCDKDKKTQWNIRKLKLKLQIPPNECRCKPLESTFSN